MFYRNLYFILSYLIFSYLIYLFFNLHLFFLSSIKSGVAFKTSPYDIAKAISQGLADSIIIAKVCYSSRLDGDSKLAQVDDEADEGG